MIDLLHGRLELLFHFVFLCISIYSNCRLTGVSVSISVFFLSLGIFVLRGPALGNGRISDGDMWPSSSVQGALLVFDSFEAHCTGSPQVHGAVSSETLDVFGTASSDELATVPFGVVDVVSFDVVATSAAVTALGSSLSVTEAGRNSSSRNTEHH